MTGCAVCRAYCPYNTAYWAAWADALPVLGELAAGLATAAACLRAAEEAGHVLDAAGCKYPFCFFQARARCRKGRKAVESCVFVLHLVYTLSILKLGFGGAGIAINRCRGLHTRKTTVQPFKNSTASSCVQMLPRCSERRTSLAPCLAPNSAAGRCTARCSPPSPSLLSLSTQFARRPGLPVSKGEKTKISEYVVI